MKFNKELVGASTGILVLSILAREANYGYRIVKRLNDESDGMFAWQEGTVYPILHKLEMEKLVRAQWETSDSGRRRRYYYITAKGRDALAQGSQQWSDYHRMIIRLGEATNG